MSAGRVLSAAEMAGYERDGFLCPLPALSAAEAAECRARLEAFEAAQGRSLARIPGQLRAKTHLLFPWLAALVRHPAVLAAVSDLIGPDLLVYHLTLWIKDAGDAAFVSWHQDGTYFGLEPADRHVTAWVALTDSTPETGCVTALPGSHRRGQLSHASRRAADNLLSNGQVVEAEVDAAAAVPLVVRAGEFSLHHTHLLPLLRSEPGRRPPHRRRDQLHPDRGAPRRRAPTHGITGPRRGPAPALRSGAAAARGLRRRRARRPRGRLRPLLRRPRLAPHRGRRRVAARLAAARPGRPSHRLLIRASRGSHRRVLASASRVLRVDFAAIPALWRLAAWAVLAFGLWVAFAWVFTRLALPWPHVGAAVLAWVAAGLLLQGALKPALHLGHHWVEGTELSLIHI